MTIIRTPAAESDLLEIWRYLADRDRMAADALIRRIDEKMSLIERHPFIGQVRHGMDDVRSIGVHRYVMLYRPIDDGVEIVRVLHGARDIPNILHGR